MASEIVALDAKAILSMRVDSSDMKGMVNETCPCGTAGRVREFGADSS